LRPLSDSVRSTLERAVQTSPLGAAGSAYLEARGLLEVASALRIGEVSATPDPTLARYAGRLVVPSLSARGTVTHITFRCMEDECEGHPKYLHWQGLDTRLYNVAAVDSDESTLHICEGQLDAATLVAAGLPAIGVPGAQSWPAHGHRLLQGFDRVLFWADRDDKGASMLLFERIRQRTPHLELVHLPDGHDVNSFYVQQGRDALLALVDGVVGEDSYTGSTGEDEVLQDVEKGEHYDELGERIPF